MLKAGKIAQCSLVWGIILSLGFGFPTPSFGLIPAQKTTLQKTDPALVLRNWGLENSEQNSHINARKAWKISKGSKKIIVAVIDTGVDAKHPNLKDNICGKPGSSEYGYDFVLNKKNPTDTHGHGTHVAGLIAAVQGKNNSGVSGVAPNVCIMAIRYFSPTSTGEQTLSNTIKAINYAVDHGARVINYSGGGAKFSSGEFKAIQRAEAKGVIFVAAAGNEYQDTDQIGNAYYPAAYGLSNIISVAATNIHDQIMFASNWGKKHIHVAAPGENIYSTMPNGRFGYLTGTSQATAFVSGLAALILSENSKLKPAEVRDIIMKTVDRVPTLAGKVASGGRINAYAALRLTIARRDGSNSKILASLDKQDRDETHLSGSSLSSRPRGASKGITKTIQAIRGVAFH